MDPRSFGLGWRWVDRYGLFAGLNMRHNSRFFVIGNNCKGRQSEISGGLCINIPHGILVLSAIFRGCSINAPLVLRKKLILVAFAIPNEISRVSACIVIDRSIL